MAGIYIHIPFCKQKCTYCDFHFSIQTKGIPNYISSLKKEVVLRKDFLGNQTIKTLYFGGGTPSLLSPTELKEIVAHLKLYLKLDELVEFTLEANPEDIQIENLLAWKEIGINRLSIGLQSLKEEDMKWMNRAHSIAQGKHAIELANQIFPNAITVDLMYGIPQLSEEEWRTHIQYLIAQNISHISAYCLTVEPKTILSNWVKTKKITLEDDDQHAKQFEILLEEMTKHGYEQYEISNFAKNQQYAIHNSSYWLGAHYLGLGPSAHSFDGQKRYWNVANNQHYFQALANGSLPLEIEELSKENRYNELILTGLRTKWGVNLKQLFNIAPRTHQFDTSLLALKAKNWVKEENDFLTLTEAGKLFADRISQELFLI